VLAVAGLFVVHLALAERSPIQENPTVDEIVHLPAHVTGWQKPPGDLRQSNFMLVKAASENAGVQ
jgi:hypothetical protein